MGNSLVYRRVPAIFSFGGGLHSLKLNGSRWVSQLQMELQTLEMAENNWVTVVFVTPKNVVLGPY